TILKAFLTLMQTGCSKSMHQNLTQPNIKRRHHFMASSNVSPRVLAEEILKLVGGKENIVTIAYCMTRLRATVADLSAVKGDELKKLDGVLGYVGQDNQIQIVLGPGRVTKVANELSQIAGITVGELDEAKVRKEEIKAKNATPFKNLLKKISNIFIPLIPAFIACGLVQGINNLIIKLSPDFGTTLVGGILTVIGAAVFSGLNLFVGVNAARE
ncbi:MAG TPA: hypothetical protein DD429_06885, partial [Clostridiaceae bacterium]|nr:hypothetical protein [Clostridiaceae bacterium]